MKGIEQIDEHYRWAISRNPQDPQAYIRRAHFPKLDWKARRSSGALGQSFGIG